MLKSAPVRQKMMLKSVKKQMAIHHLQTYRKDRSYPPKSQAFKCAFLGKTVFGRRPLGLSECTHGCAVIGGIGKNLGLGDPDMEPALMTLHRFGNTSASGLWYEVSNMDAKGWTRLSDRLLQIALGSDFKSVIVMQQRSRVVEVKGVNGSNNNNCYLLNNNNNNNSSRDLLRSGSHHENVGVNIPNRIATQNVPLNAYVGNNNQYFMGENNGECFGYEPSMNVKGWNAMRNTMQLRQRQQKMQAQIQPQFQQQQGKQLFERQARIATQAAQRRSRNVQAKAITNRSFSPFYGGGGGGGGHGGSGMSAVFLGSHG